MALVRDSLGTWEELILSAVSRRAYRSMPFSTGAAMTRSLLEATR